ncbi:MAG: hypothetical protein IKH45_01835 [Neisseriaceae bacterium]|nr:hypothetical protein [Neisseriaceae bacterium]MBR3481615.1 hypothetical protein [Neisseriaceae bacterium]
MWCETRFAPSLWVVLGFSGCLKNKNSSVIARFFRRKNRGNPRKSQSDLLTP